MIIVRNQTASALVLRTLGAPGQVIPASGQVDLELYNSANEIHDAVELTDMVKAGQILVNNGGADLTLRQSLNFLERVPRKFDQAFFSAHVVKEDYAVAADIDAGLIRAIFSDSAEIPAPPPTGAGTRAFAIVADAATGRREFYYWDVFAAGWVVSTAPFPFPPDGFHLGFGLTYTNLNQTAVDAWGFGPEFHVQRPCRLREVRMISRTQTARNWVIRKSTSTGSAAPALSSYTDVLAVGTHTPSQGEAWLPVSGVPDLIFAEDEWFCFMTRLPEKTASLGIARLDGHLLETHVIVHGDVGSLTTSGVPLRPDVPVSRQLSTIYGLISVDFGAA